MSAPSRLGLGVVGTNQRIRRTILAGIRASSAANLVAICSRDEGRANEATHEFGGSPYTDFARMLADPAVDAVMICSPHALHFSMSLAALQAGKLVMCEKPLTLSLSEAVELHHAALASGLPTVVNFTYHSLPGHRFVARLLEAGAVGSLRHVDLSYWQARQGLPDVPIGDAILDVGSHLLDLTTWWADSADAGPIVTVASHDDRGSGQGIRIWNALARTQNGTMVVIGANRQAAGWRNGMVARLIGDRGCLTLTFDTDVTEVRLAQFGAGSPEGLSQLVEIPADLVVSYRDFPGFHIDRLVGALRGSIDFPDFGYGLKIQRLLAAVSDAGIRRHWIDLPRDDETVMTLPI